MTGAFLSSLFRRAPSAVPLSYGSIMFLDRGDPCLRNFYNTIPVYVRAKSYVNHLFDRVCVLTAVDLY